MKPKYWRLIGIGVALLVVMVGYLVVMSPNRSEANALRESAASQVLANQQLRSRISLLKKQNEEIPDQLAALAEIEDKVPDNAAIPTLIRNITAAATDANVTMMGITPDQPVAMVVVTPATGDAAATDSTTDDVTATDSSTSGDATGTDSATAATPRIQRLPLTLTSCGSYAQLRTYLSNLEKLSRAMSINHVTITKTGCDTSDQSDALSASVSASVFILPAATDPTSTNSGATSATGASAATNGAS